MHAALAPLLIGVHDGFRVGVRAVLVTVRFEHPPDVGVIVNFTVEDHPDAAVLVRQRLLTAPQIDNAQTAKGEERVVGVQSRVADRDAPDIAHTDRRS